MPDIKDIPSTDRWAYSKDEFLTNEDAKLRLRLWSKKDGLVYDYDFDSVDRLKPWEPTSKVGWIQVNDQKGKVLINVITGDDTRED